MKPPRLLRSSAPWVACCALVLSPLSCTRVAAEEPPKPRKIVLVAGKKSHGPVGNGTHDYGWSVRLLKVMLENSNIKDRVAVEVYLEDGPGDLRAYDSADTIMVISDGRDGNQFAEAPHLASEERVRYFDGLLKKGCGFLTFHFSTFTPDKYAEQIFNWSGGYFDWEENGQRKWYSAIKTLDAEVQLGTPGHPVARGVQPFKMREEFYHNIRFKPLDEALKPILVVPALKGREPDGNTVAWAREREGGGRGFGTTCGHYYDNWKNDNFRKLLLNAIAWTAKVEVPKEGVEARFYTHEEIDKQLGPYPKAAAPAPKPEDKRPAAAAKPIRVLLLAGNDKHKWHNWEKTTPALQTLLERDPRVRVEVSLDIEDLARKQLSDYQVVVQNYVNWQDPRGLSEAAQKAFTGFLHQGGGLVVVHFANGAFHYSLPGANGFDWPEYRKFVQRVWNHEPKDGQPKGAHDAFGRFTVRIADEKHPLTAGLKHFEVNDELYFNQDGTAALAPLLAAESKVSKKLEPLAWTTTYGKGKVFQTLLGHSEKTYESFEARELLRRAVAWVAGQEVRPLTPAQESAAANSKPTPPVAKSQGDHFGTEGVGFRWTEGDARDDRWKDMQLGRFLASSLPLPLEKGTVGKGLSIRLGDRQEATVCYDTEHLKLRAAWIGDFLRFTPARFGLIAPPSIGGTVQFLSGPGAGWADARLRYTGLHQSGERVVLSAALTPTQGEAITIRETPWAVTADGLTVCTRTVEVGPAKVPLTMQLAEGARVELKTVNGSQLGLISLADKSAPLNAAVAVLGEAGVQLAARNNVLTLTIPPHQEPLRFTLLLGAAAEAEQPKFAGLTRQPEVVKLAAFDFSPGSQPGPARWTKEIVTRGTVAANDAALVIDTLTLPFDNPYRALFFVSGHDFFANGDIALCTVHGDVWRVSGVDARLEKLTWKRLATGLFQPLGLKVIEDQVYVLGRDQLTRLHDRNGDGEADFYENFCNLLPTSPDGHDYTTCLETDGAGNFYLLTAHQGLLRVSADGRKCDVVATGFRNPNGLGLGPGDLLTAAPQEGNWTPASNIAEVKPGGYYGFGGPRVTASRPLGYDPPLCWIPRKHDNSSGGQVWVPAGNWGPLAGHLLHLSFGQCRMMLVLREQLDPPALGGSATVQGGTVDLPGFFASGVMRGRFSPREGQLYVSGLKGWVSAATQDGCLQRVRWTGQPVDVPLQVRALKNGLAVTFSSPLDKQVAEDPDNYHLEQWNYHYSGNYGSADFKLSNPKQEGHDPVEVHSATLLDERTVFLEIPDLKPSMQLAIGYALRTQAGANLRQSLNYTLHATGNETQDATKLVRKPRPGQLSPAEEASLRPGMQARFQQENTQDVRESRLVALHVPAGVAPTAFLQPGAFRATFEGFVQVPLRGDYHFSLRGQGEATLRLNGKEVLQGKGDLGSLAPVRVALHRGSNALSLEYRSPPTGAASVRLYWQGEDFPLEPVPPQSLVHRGNEPALVASATLRRGRDLFATMRCARCHEAPAGPAALPGLEATGPDLAGVAQRLQPAWLMHWLLDPHSLQNHATMPALLDPAQPADRQRAADLTAYLLSLPAAPAKQPPGAAAPLNGRHLFEDLNCLVCHRLTAPATKDEYERTALHFVAAKYRTGMLADFLQAPHAQHRWSRMPDFHLTAPEAVALAGYLHAEAKGTLPQPAELDRADAKRGQELFRTLRCGNCHALGKETTAAPLLPLRRTANVGCLATEETQRQTAPRFPLPSPDRIALTTFLGTDRQSLARSSAGEESRRLLQHLRCGQCHSRDAGVSPQWSILGDEGRGVAPEALPHLTWTGEKLRHEWTAKFLAGEVPYRVRPWLKSRMPSFPAYAASLAQGLAAEHGLPPQTATPPAVDLKLAEVGNQLTYKNALDCRQCHAVGKEPLQGDANTQLSIGINFAHAGQRLQPEFYHRLVLDPQRYDPAGKMPKFVADLRTTKVTSIFQGDAQRQLEAIWHFIRGTAGEATTTPGGPSQRPRRRFQRDRTPATG